MQYLFLLYSDESKAQEPPASPEARAEWMAPWIDYNKQLEEAKVYVGGDALQPTSTATTVTQIGGGPEPIFTDGPFAETKEQLGGYYLVDCKSLDEALAWAAKCPMVSFGRVEVRPIMDFSK